MQQFTDNQRKVLYGLEYSTKPGVNAEIFAVKKFRRPRIRKTNRPAKVMSPRPKTIDEKWAELCEITRRIERNGMNRIKNI